MIRKSAYLLTAILVLTLTLPAFAAVENVKLSGDITVRGLYRESLGLGGIEANDTFNSAIFNPVDDDQRFYTTQIRLRVNADVTQNISGEIELLNQRDWGGSIGTQGSSIRTGVPAGAFTSGTGGIDLTTTAATTSNDQFDVILNLANITIKELYYPELSVRLGRQDIQWGEGFVLGGMQLGNADPSGSLSADEFSHFHGLDAIRFMVNKDPWHFDVVAAKVAENVINQGDDNDLYGINIGRTFSMYQSEAEIYWLGSHDAGANASRLPALGSNADGDVFTTVEEVWAIGARGSLRPWDRLKLSGETVFEWGEEGGVGVGAPSQFTLNGYRKQDIRAFAFDFRAEYDWTELIWPTTFGTEWVFYSGEEDSEDGKSGAYRPLYRGKFHSALREFQGFFYFTDVGITPGLTNQHQIMFDASFHPFNNQDLTFFTRWLLYWLDEIPLAGHGRFIGNELNGQLIYNYTEDLKLTLIGALFNPGDYFETEASSTNAAGQSAADADETAKELVAELVLAF